MDKFEEYKLFVESTQSLSGQRQSATQTYLTVNTAIFAVMVFVVKDTGLQGWATVLAGLPLFAVGTIVCLIWHRSIVQYKALIGWRYDQLRKMEDSEVLAGSHQFLIKEWENFYRPQQRKERFGFSSLEIWLPRLFAALYGLYIIILLLSTVRI